MFWTVLIGMCVHIFQVIEDFVKRVNKTDITVISQEIFQYDPYTRVENLKVKQSSLCFWQKTSYKHKGVGKRSS